VHAGGFADLFEIGAINEPAGSAAVVRRLRQDSVYRRFPESVAARDNSLRVGEREIQITGFLALDDVDWTSNGGEVVVIDGSRPDVAARSEKHLERGAHRVIVVGRPPEQGRAIVFGVNESAYDPERDAIVGTGSSALNALAPLAWMIQQRFGIARGHFAIVHPLSAAQPVLDAASEELILSRSALQNIVPGDAEEIERDLAALQPLLGTKMLGSLVHVPSVPAGCVSVAAETERRFEPADPVAALIDAAASEAFVGIMGLSDGQVASSDYTGDARSVVVNTAEVATIGRAFVAVRGWFDAEWSLACRAADLVALVCEAGIPGTA
jgi:glyceraldehyde 3-phosphate dehydrogenase